MNIVLLHGLAGSQRLFYVLQKKLSAIPGANVYAFDLLGFGEHWKEQSSLYTADDHVEFISRKIHQRFHNEKIVLIGHSMGALLALLWTIRNPLRVERLVVMNMPYGFNRDELGQSIREQKSGWGYLILAHRLTAFVSCTLLCKGGLMTMFHFLKPSYVPREVFHDYAEHSWRSLSRSFENIILENPAQELVQQIRTTPILNLIGSEDSELSRRTIEQENVQNSALKGGHFMILENPQETFEVIRKFLV